MTDDEYLKKLVIARLEAMPPNVSFSVGSYGDFTRDQLIDNVRRGTAVGQKYAQFELRMILDSPKIVGRLSGKTFSPH
jgi:hypothetical protein